jgi:hypothetical protein
MHNYIMFITMLNAQMTMNLVFITEDCCKYVQNLFKFLVKTLIVNYKDQLVMNLRATFEGILLCSSAYCKFCNLLIL